MGLTFKTCGFSENYWIFWKLWTHFNSTLFLNDKRTERQLLAGKNSRSKYSRVSDGLTVVYLVVLGDDIELQPPTAGGHNQSLWYYFLGVPPGRLNLSLMERTYVSVCTVSYGSIEFWVCGSTILLNIAKPTKYTDSIIY